MKSFANAEERKKAHEFNLDSRGEGKSELLQRCLPYSDLFCKRRGPDFEDIDEKLQESFDELLAEVPAHRKA